MRVFFLVFFFSVLLGLSVPRTQAAGSLTGTSVAVSSNQTINLTTLGTADWAHWGLGANNTPGEFDHKAVSGTAVGLISNYTVLGSGGVNGYPYNFLNCTWSDGTPTASASTTLEDYTLPTTNGSGFKITVPADTTTRTFTLYVGGYNDEAKLTAHLSDGSAADFVDTSYGYDQPGNTNGTNYQAAYTLTYSAASAGQTLSVSWVQTSSVPGNGNVNLQGATLVITPPAVPIALSATAGTGQVSLTWGASAAASSYTLYRGTTPGGEGITPYQTGLTGTSYADTGAVSGTTYYYTLRAVNGGLTSGPSNEATGTIPNFTLAASPNNFGVTPGGSAPSALTLTPLGAFSGSVTLSVSGLPSGMTAAFSPTSPVSVTAGTATTDTMTISAGSATTGTYPLTLTATSGGLTQSLPVKVTVAAASIVTNVRLTDLYLTSGALTHRIEWSNNGSPPPNPTPNYTGPGTVSNVMITGYGISRNGSALGTTTSALYWIDSQGLAYGTTYTYTVTIYYSYVVTYAGSQSTAYGSATLGSAVVTSLQSAATDDQAVDSRLDPRYSTNTLLNFNFGGKSYRGGLFAGYINDPAKVGRSLIKFQVPALPSGQHLWRVGSILAYATRNFTSGSSTTTTVFCQRVNDAWTGPTATWSLAPALPSAGNGVAVTYDGTNPINTWERWQPFYADLYAALAGNSGTLSVGLASTNETNQSWTYFAKKEYDATLTPYVLYAYGAPN